MQCSIPSYFCVSTGIRVSRHRYPRDPVQRLRWQWALSSICHLIPETFTNGENTRSQPRICSRHFREQDFYFVGGKKRLKCSAVPSLNENFDHSSSSKRLKADRAPLLELSRNVSQSSTRQQLSMNNVDNSMVLMQPSTDIHKIDETEWKRTTSIVSLDQAPTFEVDDQNPIPATDPGAKLEKKQKVFRYAGNIKNVDQLSINESRQALLVVQKQLKSSQQNIKKIQQRNLRLKKKNKSLQAVMNELQARGLISDKGQLMLQAYSLDSELQKELVYGRYGQPYGTALRSFATTLLYYSPKAYRYVREQFDKKLPQENTVARW